jgi:cobalt transporter subunit CbtB
VTTIPVPSSKPRVTVSPEALSKGRVAAILSVTVLLALIVYYFVGIDEGMTSIFGKTLVIHEWVHDSRHFLGFPCH